MRVYIRAVPDALYEYSHPVLGALGQHGAICFTGRRRLVNLARSTKLSVLHARSRPAGVSALRQGTVAGPGV